MPDRRFSEEDFAILIKLGIDPASFGKPAKKIERVHQKTTKTATPASLKPYYLRAIVTCKCCGARESSLYYMQPMEINNTTVTYLKSTTATYAEPGVALKNSFQRRETCDNCRQYLRSFHKDELITLILNMRLGHFDIEAKKGVEKCLGKNSFLPPEYYTPTSP